MPRQNSKAGFTLMELLIVVALLAILLVAILIALNARGQLDKANDAKRKHDLELMQKAIEEWFNDKGCYPHPNEICYDSSAPTNVCRTSKQVSSIVCHICGSDRNSPTFSPYLSPLPCDPEQAAHRYLYEVEVNPPTVCTPSGVSCQSQSCSNNYCPLWYRLYTDFDTGGNSHFDPQSESSGCEAGGCGLSDAAANFSGGVFTPFGYDYGLSSTNKALEFSTAFMCVDSSNKCQYCPSPGTYDSCVSNPGCGDKNKIYSSYQACISSPSHPH